MRLNGVGSLHRDDVLLVLLLHLVNTAGEHHLGMVEQGNLLAHFLDRCHVVGREQDGAALVTQGENLDLQLLGIHGVKARERFVKDQQGRAVDNGADELHLLLHTLGQVLHLFVFPFLEVKAVEPPVHRCHGIVPKRSKPCFQKN